MSAVLSTERKSDDVSETRAYSHMRSVKTPHATAQTGSSSAPPKVDKDRRAGEVRAAPDEGGNQHAITDKDRRAGEVRAAPDEGDNQHAITQGGEGRTLLIREAISMQSLKKARGARSKRSAPSSEPAAHAGEM